MTKTRRPGRNSLANRLLWVIGWATVLPLVILTAIILFSSYQTLKESTYSGIQQTSRRIATDFESRINAKVSLLKGVALALEHTSMTAFLGSVLAEDPDLRDIWVSTLADDPSESLSRQNLFREVQTRGTEFLTAPNFDTYQASLGVPIHRDGKVAAVVGVSFSLDFFQQAIIGVKFLKTGYAFMVSHEGLRIAHPKTELIGQIIGTDVGPEMSAWMLGSVAAGQDFWFEKKALFTGKWSRQFYSAIRVGSSPAPWFFAVIAPEEESVETINNLFLVLLTGIFGTLALVAATTWRATRSVVLPLRELATGAEAIAEGHLDTRVSWSSADELGTLAAAFNRMTDQLVQTLRDQEAIVRQRTAKLVDSEKMAVLGQLTAAIAHEINTPLGAIRSSATYLHQTVVAQSGDLSDQFRALSETDLEFYKDLVLGRRMEPPTRQAGEDRKRRRQLTSRLEAQGVAEPEGLADDMVFLVPAEEDPALIDAIVGGQGPVVRLAAQTAAMVRSSAIILESADRAASTVAALVNYIRVDDLGANQAVDPAKELDTLLALYYGLSKKGVTVVRDFDPGVVVWGDRDRLNQVWVNLINNALQAMGYRGTLILRVKAAAEGPSVAVANDGPAIPSELREKIFHPFFTTKKAGEGTGLGLDICRRIIEAHQGTLTLSEEGRLTVFTARFVLPVLDPAKPVH